MTHTLTIFTAPARTVTTVDNFPGLDDAEALEQATSRTIAAIDPLVDEAFILDATSWFENDEAFTQYSFADVNDPARTIAVLTASKRL